MSSIGYAVTLSDISIIADDSLQDPIREIVRQYVRKNYMSVAVQFGNYMGLLDFNNKDTDIIIMNNESNIAFLKNNDLVEKDIIYIANDPLMVVVNSLEDYPVKSNIVTFLKEISKQADIVIVDPNNSLAGYLSYKLLLSLGIRNFIQVKDEEKARHLINNSKAIGLLASSNAQDFTNSFLIPEALYEPMRYHIIVLKNRSSENTNSFLKFLLLNKNVLKEYGMSINS